MLRRTAIVGVVAVPLVIGLVPAASADVLISRPPGKKCIGKKFRVGVWNDYSGGPRGVRVKVVGPRGKVLLKKRLRATHQWKYWRIKVKRRGKYRTVYKQGLRGKPAWKQRYRTRGRRC